MKVIDPKSGTCTEIWWRHAQKYGGDMQKNMVGTCTEIWWGQTQKYGGDMHRNMVGTCTEIWWGHAQKYGGDMHKNMVGTDTNKLMGSQPSTLDTNVLSIQNSLIYSIYDFSFNWIMDFKEKDVVWVKLCRYPWWPAQVSFVRFTSRDTRY